MDGLVNYGLVDPNLTNALSAGYRGAEQNRLKMQAEARTAQIDQMKLEDLKRNREIMLKLQSDLVAAGHDPDLNKVFDALIATGDPNHVARGIEGKQHLKEQQAFAALMGGAGTPASAAAPAAAPAAVPMTAPVAAPMAAPAPAPAPAPAVAAPTVNALTAPSMRDPAAAAATRKRIDDLMAFAAANPGMASMAMQQARILQDQLELQSRNAPTKPAALAELEAYMNMTPEQKAAFEKLNKIKSPGTGAAAQTPPVAVVDPDTGTVVYVDRAEAVRRRLTPATSMEGVSPKEIQKREANFPQATLALKGFETKADLFIRDLKALRDDPGLEQITGVIYGRTPSVSPKGRRAQALYNKVTAKGGFQALQDLREASKTGGALGNISNQEGKQLTASFAAIDRTQEAQDLQNEIDQVIDDIEGSKTRMREAYDSTYAYRQDRGKAGGDEATPPSKPAAAKPITKKTKSGVAYTVEED